MKYRKKSLVVEAFLPCSNQPAPKWYVEAMTNGTVVHRIDGSIDIRTLEGMMKADHGDYIIKGVQGEIYPCKPDIFEKTYEKVDDTSSYGISTDQAFENIKDNIQKLKEPMNIEIDLAIEIKEIMRDMILITYASGKHETLDGVAVTVDWLIMSNDDFIKRYGFDFTPSERLQSIAKSKVSWWK